MRRQVLSTLLALIMTLSLVPETVFAQELGENSGQTAGCICMERCAEECVNQTCPVCKAGGWEACQYTEQETDTGMKSGIGTETEAEEEKNVQRGSQGAVFSDDGGEIPDLAALSPSLLNGVDNEDAVEIGTADELMALLSGNNSSDTIGKTYLLTADMEIDTSELETGFLTSSRDYERQFSGTLDGGGHTITVSENTEGNLSQPLFDALIGQSTQPAVIKNLTVEFEGNVAGTTIAATTSYATIEEVEIVFEKDIQFVHTSDNYAIATGVYGRTISGTPINVREVSVTGDGIIGSTEPQDKCYVMAAGVYTEWNFAGGTIVCDGIEVDIGGIYAVSEYQSPTSITNVAVCCAAGVASGFSQSNINLGNINVKINGDIYAGTTENSNADVDAYGAAYKTQALYNCKIEVFGDIEAFSHGSRENRNYSAGYAELNTSAFGIAYIASTGNNSSVFGVDEIGSTSVTVHGDIIVRSEGDGNYPWMTLAGGLGYNIGFQVPWEDVSVQVSGDILSVNESASGFYGYSNMAYAAGLAITEEYDSYANKQDLLNCSVRVGDISALAPEGTAVSCGAILQSYGICENCTVEAKKITASGKEGYAGGFSYTLDPDRSANGLSSRTIYQGCTVDVGSLIAEGEYSEAGGLICAFLNNYTRIDECVENCDIVIGEELTADEMALFAVSNLGGFHLVGNTVTLPSSQADVLTIQNVKYVRFTAYEAEGRAVDPSWESGNRVIFIDESENSVTCAFDDGDEEGTLWRLTPTRFSRTLSYQYTGDVPEKAPALPSVVNAWPDDLVTVADAPTLDGYLFSGWSVQSPSGVTITNGKLTMPDENVIVVGSWTKEEPETVIIAPADITIYTGGNSYGGTANPSGQIVSSSGLPEPGFVLTLPESLTADDVEELVLQYEDQDIVLTWSFEPYGGGSHNVYRIVPGEGTEKRLVRIIFTNEAGETVTSDQFQIQDHLDQTLTMEVYGEGINTGKVSLWNGKIEYRIAVQTGEITVRNATSDAVYGQIADKEEAVASRNPGLVVREGTVYTINGGSVQVDDDSGVALLFDNIIEANSVEGTSNTALLTDKAEAALADSEVLTGQGVRHYQFKYLDLVDTQNGNAWVTADQPVTVCWPLPPGTSKNTQFELLHFPGLHRETDTSVVADEIDQCEVNKVTITQVTDDHITFTIGAGGFSPFALAWETTKVPGGDDDDDRYILIFESNGGTEFDNIIKDYAFTVNPYENHVPVRSGYVFTGWYHDRSLRQRIEGDIRITGVKTIYAGWRETDVPEMLNGDDHYAYMIGYADGTFRPYANVTRAQVATIFFRLLTEETRQAYLTSVNAFPDVGEDYWANTAISTMAALGVINGRNSGLFDPDAPITRAEFAAICARFDQSDTVGSGSSLTDIAGHWAEAEIRRAEALGWVQGFNDGTFRSNENITRAQAVTMINRVLRRLPENSEDLLPEMNTWTDCQESDWFYLAVHEATNSHDFQYKDGVHERWTVINPDPDWKQYE